MLVLSLRPLLFSCGMLAYSTQTTFADLSTRSASSTTCPICCSACAVERCESQFMEGSSDAVPFVHLLSAGTITLSLLSSDNLCDHHHAEDGWHTLRDVRFLSSVEDAKLLEALSFLLRHRFIVATYSATQVTKVIAIRIYLIPHDLPGSAQILRNRNEIDILKPAREYLRFLLFRVGKSHAGWYGEVGMYSPHSIEESFLQPNGDHRPLAQIFSELATIKSDISVYHISHLRAHLYDYQRESVAAMIEMEEHRKVIDDPLYVPVNGMMGETFYFQPGSMEILWERPRVSPSKGGFLCEELGTGKTVMMLALILATLDTLPNPPDHISAEVMTPLAFRNGQHSSSDVTRELARRGILKGARRFPTLVESLCHYIRVNPENIDVRSYEDELDDRHLWAPLMSNTPFYLHDDSVFRGDSGRPQRGRKVDTSRVIYLSAATLIVVPKTLQAQWRSEILKHCSSKIRTLVIEEGTVIPTPDKLASDYDIVLIKDTQISFVQAPMNDMLASDINHTCRCPPFWRVRIPKCTCRTTTNVSPLLQVRWKRLVRDEGHNAASQSVLNDFLNLVSAERRWLVTGTPTKHLLGLSFGTKAEDATENRASQSQNDSEALPLIYKLSDDLSTGISSEDINLHYSQYPAHVWSPEDRTDLGKLKAMMASFLGVLPFAADPHAFKLVMEPLFGEDGPLPGATRVLEQVMSAYMVRHRVADIERCVKLPPLKEETVLLDLDEYGQMTYNAMLSFIAVNAVDSERKDQDYLFHYSSTTLLAQTITNLSHALFWRGDDDALDYELPENVFRAEKALANAIKRGQPDEDIRLINQAIVHLRKALNNRQFREIQHVLEVPYRIRNVPPRTKQAWGIAHDPAFNLNVPFFMYPSYAIELRDALVRQPLASENRVAELATLVREKNRAQAALVAERSRERRSSTSEKSRRRQEAETGRLKLSQVQRTMDSKEKLKEKHEEFRKALERLRALSEMDEQDHPVPHQTPVSTSDAKGTRTGSTPRTDFIRNSPFAKVHVGNSASSKINYILNEARHCNFFFFFKVPDILYQVRKYSTTEKILIFSKEPFNLAHITEGLDLMGVKYLHFMNDAGTSHRRDQWLTTFETSETYRVFLMQLKDGARGLNIVTASRVIFCEPVWHADVESQAIKRVHRIGQTRPVTVKTLAIRSTFEEYMIHRRRDFKETGSKPPGLAEEIGVRQYLQNPIFLEAPTRSVVELNFPLLRLPEAYHEAELSLTEQELRMESSVEVTEVVAAAINSPPKSANAVEYATDVGRANLQPSNIRQARIDSLTATSPQKRRKVHFG